MQSLAPWTHRPVLNGPISWTHSEHRRPSCSPGYPHWCWNHLKWPSFVYLLLSMQLKHLWMNVIRRQWLSKWWLCWLLVNTSSSSSSSAFAINGQSIYDFSLFLFSLWSFPVCILCVNCYSVNLGMAVQNIFTTAKMVAVLIIISGGAYKLYQGNVQYLQNAFSSPMPPLGAMAAAFYTGLWAYDGWNNLNYVTEEIQNPSKWVLFASRWWPNSIQFTSAGYLNLFYFTIQKSSTIDNHWNSVGDPVLCADQRIISGRHVPNWIGWFRSGCGDIW